jgi:hypothetical protein
MIVAGPSSEQDQLSPSQRARLERLRQPAGSLASATMLADQINSACDEVEYAHAAESAAREDAELAWLVLCDRGWPREVGIESLDSTQAFAWLAVWAELTSLPVEVTTPQDRSKLKWIEERLATCEAPLQRSLPAALWGVVGPLDSTGRATLAFALLALAALIDARAVCAAATSRRDELIEDFRVFRQRSRKLGVRAPLAPTDVRAWRATAAAIRAVKD